MANGKLERIKDQIKMSRNSSAFMFAFATIFLVANLKLISFDNMGILVYAVSGALGVYSVFMFIKYSRLLKEISVADPGMTYEMKLYRPKVKMIAHSGFRTSRRRYSREKRFIGITFIDEKKGRYHYFFGDTWVISPSEVKDLKEKFYRDISIECYKNTHIVKLIENDPYFLGIG